MKDIRTLFLLLAAVFCLASCEESEEAGEFDNWQERNAQYVDSVASVARANADGSWKVLLAEGLDPQKEWPNDCYVYCKVLEKGTGTASPLFTDTVSVNYVGRLIPTKNYSAGFVFDSSYSGELDPEFDVPVTFVLSGTVSGFYTALQQMTIGDRWMLYIPSELAYGVSGTTGVPAYSTLIFDIDLVSFSGY